MKRKIFLVMALSSLALYGCGGGDSSGDSNKQTTTTDAKRDRLALSASDLDLTYSKHGIAYPQVNNIYGSTQLYRLADGAASDVVMVDSSTGALTLLAAGETKIEVEDSSAYYKTSVTTFNVTVKPTENSQLFSSYLQLPTIETKKAYLSVQGNKGDLSYRFEPANFVTFDEDTHYIVSNGQSGKVTVTITDSGNRNYLPSTVTSTIDIHSVNPDVLSYQDLERPFTEGLTLNPVKMSGVDSGTYQYELAEGYENSDVVSVAPNSGYINVLSSGSVKIKATQQLGSTYGDAKQESYFDVRILKGSRQPLQISNAEIPYQADYIYTPAVNNNKAEVRYEVLNGNNVVEVDSQTNQLKIIGVGFAEIKVVDDQNGNYHADERLFQMTVSKAVHPHFKSQELTYRFNENQSISPTLQGQLGSLSFSGSSDVVAPSGNKLLIKNAGIAELSVTDDGGEYYQPATAALTINVLKAAHPAWTVRNITTTYVDGSCVNLSVSGNKGDLRITPVSSADDHVAQYDASKQCFTLKRSGSANFDVVSEASKNYLASDPKRVKLVVNPASSHLKVDGGLVRTFVEGRPTTRPPAIGGGTGNLRFELVAEQSDSGVIEVDPNTGVVTLLEVGSALVRVTDSGDDKSGPASVTFPVTIEQADNPVTVSYSNAVYEKGGVISPVFNNVKGPLSYQVYNEDTSPVQLGVGNGEVTMRSTGSFFVTVNAQATRNYKAKEFNEGAFIDKAPHPGIAMKHESIEYAPLKKVTLDLPTAYGSRSYSVANVDGNASDYASIDYNSGEVSLLDYDASNKLAYVHISERESEFYKASDSRVASRTIKVNPPEPGQSTQDIPLAAVFTSVESSLNHKPQFSGLGYSLLGFAGAKVLQPTEDEVQRLGKGVALEVMMKSVDESLPRVLTQPIRIYVRRYEGCATKVHLLNIPNLMREKEEVSIERGSYCLFNKTSRYVTYTVVDKSRLEAIPYDGEWVTEVPFVVYRQAEKYYSPNEQGGFEVHGPGPVTGSGQPVKLLEWNRIELKITKDTDK
ncbi:hypothetical protein MHO82_08860 [Vibrio sp. Of7-15]|nr:hypothetical protein [Vibrio sp. Of7-15]